MDRKGAEMQEEMDETLAGLTDNLGKLEQRISGTVKTVTESVSSIRNTIDLRLHVRRRPWTLMAGAAALGLFGGYCSGRGRAVRHALEAENSSKSSHPYSGVHAHASETGSRSGTRTEHAPVGASCGLIAYVGKKFEPATAELRGHVIGTLLDLARELIINQARKPAKKPDGTAPDVRRSRPLE